MVNMKFNWKEAMMWLALQEKMKLDWELIGIILLFLIMALAGASQSQAILISQGPFTNTYYDSDTGRYTQQIFNSQINVWEGGKWVYYQNAKSLLGIWNVVYLKNDSNFSLNVTDINFTAITVSVSSKVQGTIPFKACKASDLSEASCQNATTIAVSAISAGKAQVIIIPIDNAPQYTNLTWGTSSTTIQINGTGIFGDSQVGFASILDSRQYSNGGAQTWMEVGNQTDMGIYNYTSIIKFNISGVPSSQTINDAELGLMLVANHLAAGQSQNISISHVYNNSGGFSWVQGIGSNDVNPTCTDYAGSNASGGITGDIAPKTSSQRNLTVENTAGSTNNITSSVVANTLEVWNVTNAVTLEYLTNTASNRQNVSLYLIVSSTQGSSSAAQGCIMFNTSEATYNKPYLNITYTAGGASSNPAFSVSWNSPTNNTWNTSQTITFNYTPLWYDNTMKQCDIWENKTGTFILAASNSTPLTNNSVNNIAYNFAGDYNLVYAYINCTNTTGASNFTGNYTIKIDTTAPSTPTLTLASSGETWINLNIGSCTDAGSGILKKLLYRNGTNIANLTSETTYNDTPLSGCATAYSYLLGCLDNVGLYGSNSTQLNTNTNHSTAPTTPTGLANTSISSSCIDLDWNDCTATGCSIDTYRIFKNSSLTGTNTTSFFHECGLTNCTSYGYTVDVNDSGGLYSANSSIFTYTTNGCYIPPPADRSPPTINLTSPANGANRTSSSTTFTCNASSNNTLANASLYSNFTGTWQLNETKSETGSSATESFTKTLTNGSYIWNCQWCNTFNNCSFAISNWSVNVNITPSAAGSGGLIFIQNGGGDWSMIDVFVTALIVLVFVYLHVHQEDPAWKIGYLMMALIMMSVTIVLTVQDLSISGKVVTSVVYDSGTSTYNLAYGSVTNTTSQQAILTSLLNPINWVLYLIIAVVLVGLMIKIVEYATTPRK